MRVSYQTVFEKNRPHILYMRVDLAVSNFTNSANTKRGFFESLIF